MLPLQYGVAATPVQVKLSILMAAYNEERAITQAVQELIAIEYPCDFELIIVDDGSTDRTARFSPGSTTRAWSCTIIQLTGVRGRPC